ncbi:tyrosine kinase receptor Cad96Ca-like [Diadema antillarum]|uniref:tyrosine kinase receptor Cad96Ca-like n=1 Tax=Diadema antillarum TaxID=105358 RepID=UPI003A8B2066
MGVLLALSITVISVQFCKGFHKDDAVYQPLTKINTAIGTETLAFFSRLGSIGVGNFGDVWKGELRTKQGVASVALRQFTENSPDLLHLVTHLRNLPNHPNITSKSPYANIKPLRPRFNETELLTFAWQVAKGMDFLESNKIVHGNLCAHNILMKEDRICKISDYGMTSIMSPAGNKPTRWMSPEGMQNKDWSLEGDVWSYGILLWEIVTLGARPYPKMTMDMVEQQVTMGYKMPRPSHCGQELYSIMTSCWEMEPAKRCSYDGIQQKLELTMELYHEYLSLQNFDEELYDDVADVTA